MALASFTLSRSWQETRKSGSSVLLSDMPVPHSVQSLISAGFSESAQYLQDQITEMTAWRQFISNIRTQPDDIEKDITVFFPPKSRKTIKAQVRHIVRPAILIVDEDIYS